MAIWSSSIAARRGAALLPGHTRCAAPRHPHAYYAASVDGVARAYHFSRRRHYYRLYISFLCRFYAYIDSFSARDKELPRAAAGCRARARQLAFSLLSLISLLDEVADIVISRGVGVFCGVLAARWQSRAVKSFVASSAKRCRFWPGLFSYLILADADMDGDIAFQPSPPARDLPRSLRRAYRVL